jgi:hypothetical protein
MVSVLVGWGPEWFQCWLVGGLYGFSVGWLGARVVSVCWWQYNSYIACVMQ